MDASKIHARRLAAKEVLTPMKMKNLCCQLQMEQSKLLKEIDAWDHPLYLGILNEERNKKFFEENQRDSLLQPLFKMTQPVVMRKSKKISGRSQEILFIVIKWNSESNCTCRKKNHFLFHWNTSTLPEPFIRHWMYCWTNTLMITGTWMEKENYQMHGQASQESFQWTKGHFDGYTWSEWRLTRKQTTSRPHNSWPDIGVMQRKAKRR